MTPRTFLWNDHDRKSPAGIGPQRIGGGSIKDEDVIKAADDKGLAMVFTGMRHFRH